MRVGPGLADPPRAESPASEPTRTVGSELLALVANVESQPTSIAELFGLISRMLKIAQLPGPVEDFLAPRAAAEFLGISHTKLYAMNDTGKFPAPVDFDGAPRYWVSEILAWCAAGGPPRSQWVKVREQYMREIIKGRLR